MRPNFKLIVLAFCALMWGMTAVSAMASSTHSHHDGMHHDHGKKARSAHCILLGHGEVKLCPHEKGTLPLEPVTCSLRSDCGAGIPFSAPGTSSYKPPLKAEGRISSDLNSFDSVLAVLLLDSYRSISLGSLDPPPKFFS